MKSRDDHSHLIPSMAGKGRCTDRQAGTLGPRQTHEFYGGMARGPQPVRGGRRCQEPLECPTLATLADALEAIGVNGCRPGWPRLPAAGWSCGEVVQRIRHSAQAPASRLAVGGTFPYSPQSPPVSDLA